MNEIIVTITGSPLTALIMGLLMVFLFYYVGYRLEAAIISKEDYEKGYRLFDRNGLKKSHKKPFNRLPRD